ncbi:hypothetical protein PLESTB_001371200 [Pleodorina starrii]|uniref:Methyltransferase FkbM domain-containing protein n=1 Tax=Pleodorina starrii TaxID=330485 RepID=A0A9W6F7H2_9CHLO|nr:hypothetical protein PLESTM_000413900 [Pleodorina starrii]GLC58531.1 hypothetical protein PLESTB_001371200 [Pleodorina starrii]GLC74183.1 hypothetical protein PLESTF_001471000 [Pleodorina starrii]
MYRGSAGRANGGVGAGAWFPWMMAPSGPRRRVLLLAACSLAAAIMLLSLLSTKSASSSRASSSSSGSGSGSSSSDVGSGSGSNVGSSDSGGGSMERLGADPIANPRLLSDLDLPKLVARLLSEPPPSVEPHSQAQPAELETPAAVVAAAAAAAADDRGSEGTGGGGGSGAGAVAGGANPDGGMHPFGQSLPQLSAGVGAAGAAAAAAGGGSGGSGDSGGDADGAAGGAAGGDPWRPGDHLYLERLGFELETSLRQQVFCEEAFPLLELEAAAEAETGSVGGGGGGGGFAGGAGLAARQLAPGVAIYVYAGDDEVSRLVRSGAGWENELLREILWALEQPLPYHLTVAGSGGAAAAAATAAAMKGQPSGREGTVGRRLAAAATAAGDGAKAMLLDSAAVRRAMDAVNAMEAPTAPATAVSGVPGGAASGAAGSTTGTAAATPAAAVTAGASPPPLFVDVGANVGWFAVNAAARGYRVAAFEGMATNVGLMRASVCASPALAGRLRLFSFGLGDREAQCYLFSDINNRGDGITMCDATSQSDAAARVPRGYALRGRLRLRRMDSVLKQPRDGDIKVLKVDVEGYEPHVFAGMGDLRAWYIATEFNPVLLSGVNPGYRPAQLLEDLLSRRYRLSTASFRGPWLTEGQVRRLAAEVKHPVSMYGAHEDLFVQFPGGA